MRAWEEAAARNVPDDWRKNPRFLESLKKVINDGHLDEHIRRGHFARRSDGSISGITGVHSKDAITVSSDQTIFSQGDVRIRPGTRNPPNPSDTEVYEVEPEVWGLNKSTAPPTEEWRRKNGNLGKSTFFPDGWTTEKIQNEIAYVRQKLTSEDIDLENNWYATWNSEGTFKIAMYVDDLQDLSSSIGSAFPLLP